MPIALLAAFSVLLGSGTSAYAGQPNEENTWHKQGVNAYSDMSEARDPQGNSLQVWEGDGQTIQVRVNGSAAFALANAQTRAAPVVQYSNGQFVIFHTGTNGYVFYEWADLVFGADGTYSLRTHGWIQVPNGVRTNSNEPVSVTVAPGGLYLAFLAADNSGLLYGDFYSRDTGQWNSPSFINGARSTLGPTVSYSSNGRMFILAYTGEDRRVYIARLAYGSNDWGASVALPGVHTYDRPGLAMASNGNGQVAVRTADLDLIELNSITENLGSSGWTYDTGGIIARFAPVVLAYGTWFYAIVTAGNGDVWWKNTRH
ncbi:hypothetical protein [Kitasatospora sp. NPDC057015]|uniref:hypothetical protein n=1 Tax=Kitasatospora sp. NPDC057015 TaxID=3346001 RepID=UPI003628D436